MVVCYHWQTLWTKIKTWKTMTLILTLTSLIICTSYLVYVYLTCGILTSISASYYHIKPKNLFTFWTWGTALPMMIAGSTALAFFSGAFLCFVGAASNEHNDDMTSRVHGIGAKGAVVFGFAFLIFDLGLWWLAAASMLSILLMYLLKIKNSTWWIECVAYYTIITGLLMKV